jgi:hypothetical protein
VRWRITAARVITLNPDLIPRKAKRSFWLDGGYDRNIVEACPHHPRHRWWTFRVGDVVENCYDPDERMTICAACYVPRCGATTQPDRCVLPRHHTEPHLTEARVSEPVGGYA